MAKKKTVFQALDNAISGNWGASRTSVAEPHVNSYDMTKGGGNNIIYKTDNKDDYLQKKLELQQDKYLKDRWVKANVNLSVTAYAGLNNIKLMYRDADLMDAFPEIGAALDIVSEESCLHGDTQIKLLNGEIKTIEELYNEDYKNFWVYAVDSNGNCKPSKVDRVANNGKKAIYEIGLDDGSIMKCTSNHQWLLSNNNWKRTDELFEGDSLMSIYDKLDYKGYKSFEELREHAANHIVRYVKRTNDVSTVYDLVNSSCNNCFAVKCNDGQIISHNCIVNDKGMVVNVYSKSDRIKSILEDLFVNRLNVQLTGQMIIRAMCKYGNQFMLLDIDHKNGVKGWKQLPVFNMERIENGIQNPYGAGASIAVNGITKDDADLSTQFIWLDDNNSQVPFRDWQIAHFRLLTNSLYLPYGVSYLNAARRHWRMLSLMEDMMLIYRLERSFERRVYKIFVGAIDDADVQGYVERIANEFKRTPIIDPVTGQVDLRKNILPVHKDTPIPLLDGRTITIENLAKEFEEGKENYVYSVQDKTHKIVPGKVVWCGKNYTAEKLYKITLDDDSHMILAGEHEIIMRDGTKKRADEVNVGESVMPLYRKNDRIASHYEKEYEKTYNPYSGNYEFTHRLVANDLPRKCGDNVIHHIDFNQMNNSPSNLKWMTWDEHRDYHASLNSTERVRNNRKLTSSRRWLDNNIRGKLVRNMTIAFDDHVWDEINNAIRDGIVYSQKTMLDFINENLIDHLISINKVKRLSNKRKISKFLLHSRIKDVGFKNCDEYLIDKEARFNLKSHFDLLNEEKSKRAKKNNAISNIKVRWENTDKSDEIRRKISNSNLKRYKAGAYETIKEKNSVAFDDYVWGAIKNAIIARRVNRAVELYEFVNTNLIDYILKTTKAKIVLRNRRVSNKLILSKIREKFGFAATNDFIDSMRINHKISKIEVIGGDDVYCMTVVGLNGEDDRHNFALTTWKSDGSLNESGVFVSNCIDQDIFIPVRDENAPTPIDTLAAGQNMTALDDIKFVQNKVMTALRIPKSFLNFEEATGDGKNLALMDIRFTRTVNRIQQAFLMELTKVASIHLFLLGFNDELTNFSLSMNNPSTQAEQLEIENMQKKIDAVRDAVSDPGNGLPVMSQTRALKQIMKWSEKEIKENLEEIRLEKGIAAELEKTTQIIKKTGIFDTVDRIYGEPGAEYLDDQQVGQGGMDDGSGGPMGGGSTPPPPMGDAPDTIGGDIGGPGDDTIMMGGAEGSMPTSDIGNDPNAPMEAPNESRYGRKPLINEGNAKLDDMFAKYLSKLNEHHVGKTETQYKRAEVYDSDSLFINEEFDSMIDALGKFVDKED